MFVQCATCTTINAWGIEPGGRIGTGRLAHIGRWAATEEKTVCDWPEVRGGTPGWEDRGDLWYSECLPDDHSASLTQSSALPHPFQSFPGIFLFWFPNSIHVSLSVLTFIFHKFSQILLPQNDHLPFSAIHNISLSCITDGPAWLREAAGTHIVKSSSTVC